MATATLALTPDQTSELYALRHSIREAAAETAKRKDDYANSKKHLEGLRGQLESLIDEFEQEKQPRLPFGKPAAAAAEPKGHTVNPDAPVLPEGDVPLKYDPDTDLRWRRVPITDLRLTDRITYALEHANIFNLGQLVDYASDGHTNLTDIKGVGEAAVDKVAVAMSEFWKTAAERFGPTPVAQVGPSPDDEPEPDENDIEQHEALNSPEDDGEDDDLDEDDLDDEADLIDDEGEGGEAA